MTRIDTELIAVIYAMYGYECIHWLKEENIAFTRSFMNGWTEWKHTSLSFTLLRRLPCAANPLPFAPGFISLKQGSVSDNRIASILLRLDRFSARRHASLRIAVSVQSVIILILLPVVIALQALSFVWLPLLALLIISHVATLYFFVRNLRSFERDSNQLLMLSLPIFFNPIAAIRSGDVLLQRLFLAFLTNEGRKPARCEH
jgi:hypothetical protein